MSEYDPHPRRAPVSVALLFALAIGIGGCSALSPPIPAPQTFNQSALLAELSTTALARSCASMLRDKIITAEKASTCHETVTTAGDAIDAARALGPDAGGDRLAAALALINGFRNQLENRP